MYLFFNESEILIESKECIRFKQGLTLTIRISVILRQAGHVSDLQHSDFPEIFFTASMDEMNASNNFFFHIPHL